MAEGTSQSKSGLFWKTVLVNGVVVFVFGLGALMTHDFIVAKKASKTGAPKA